MKTPESICPDFLEWPERWAGVEEDVAYGRGVRDAMRPFVAHLIAQGLKEKTVRSHMDNLWLLGGEVVRSAGMSEEYGVPPEENLRRHVDEEGGPYCRHLHAESEQTSFDATCKKLHRFLEACHGDD